MAKFVVYNEHTGVATPGEIHLFCAKLRPLNNHDDDSNLESSKPVQPRNSPSTRDDFTGSTLGLDAAGAPATRDLTGVIVGDYNVLQLIGSGGGGQVYQAQHRHMGRMVAIKVLSHMESSTSEMGQRFRREVKTSARLMHPNIVTAFDAGEFDEVPYLVMEFVDGQSLYQLVGQNGPLSLQQATALIMQTATGLAYAHSEGIVHRDIKPSNLMVDKDSQLKILDMGLARLSSMATLKPNEPLNAELTSHGTVVGTAGYISPEQISNSRRVDHRTDIYSLGCTYHFLLTGTPPYTGSVMEMLVAHARDPVPTLHATRAEVPPALDSIFQRMMAKDLSDRFASMDRVLSALEPFAEGQTTTHLADQGVEVAKELSSTLRIKSSDSTTIALHKAVGFDIGTHTSHASWIGEEGYPQVIEQQGMAATPSVVRYQEGEFVMGQQALESFATDAENIGDRFVSELGQENSCCVLDGSEFPFELLTAVIARQMADNARQQIGSFKHIAYTVPGCFGDVRRRAYADSFQIAYLDAFTPLNASSAIATYYSFMHGWLNPQRPAPKDQLLLIIRFGGGSFDASVIRVNERNISTLAIVGDTSIGGAVWDDRIVKCVADQFESEHGIDIHGDRASLLLLRRHCESGKMALTHQDQFPFRVQIKGKALEGVLSRSFVNRLGADFIKRAESSTTEVLSEAGVTWDEIDHVLLTGGTSKMPIVRESVEQWSGCRNVTSIVESEAASGGAALYAQVQTGGSHPSLDVRIHEVTSHYVGIRGMDRQTGKERTSVVIPRNTSLPATAKGIFRTSKDGQTSLLLRIAEGSDKEGKESWLLGSCQIANLPPGQPAGTPIEIELHVAENGTVSVFVESIATGRRSSPEIQRAGGLAVDERNRWRDLLYTGCMDLADPK